MARRRGGLDPNPPRRAHARAHVHVPAFNLEDFSIDHPGLASKSRVGGQDPPGLASKSRVGGQDPPGLASKSQAGGQDSKTARGL